MFCDFYSSKCRVSNVASCRNRRSKMQGANSALDFRVNVNSKLVRHEALFRANENSPGCLSVGNGGTVHFLLSDSSGG
ncbi:hypothetical protein M0R45_033385 [Rubus argutus]|uniref:Uncharacterized protein n=1 Tax=Rubus argutus TaxID=59490 RepID=A0AAW1WJP8_RUBAR